MNPAGLLFVLIGAVALGGAIFEWSWFMDGRKARAMTSLMGRKAARGLYAVLGSALIVLGLLLALGVLHSK